MRVADASSKDSKSPAPFKNEIRYILPFGNLFSGPSFCLDFLIDNVRDYVKETDFSTS